MRRALLTLAVTFGLAGCPDHYVIPTIPIPPPDQMNFTIDDAASTATLSFDLEPMYAGDVVYVFNLTQADVSVGGVVDAAGAFTSAPFPAQREDLIDILFREIHEDGDDAYGELCVILRDGPLSEADRCPNP